MRLPSANPWVFWVWIALVLFSQTAAAGALADALVSLFLEPEPARESWTRFVTQKGFHVALFGGVGALLALRPRRPSRAEALGWCVGFSVLAECLQIAADNRNASPWDALLNVAAASSLYALTARATARGSRPGSSPPHPR